MARHPVMTKADRERLDNLQKLRDDVERLEKDEEKEVKEAVELARARKYARARAAQRRDDAAQRVQTT